jgi:hypothetical protein
MDPPLYSKENAERSHSLPYGRLQRGAQGELGALLVQAVLRGHHCGVATGLEVPGKIHRAHQDEQM